MFLKIDTSNDGFLSLEEVKAGISETLGEPKAQVTDWNELVDQLDLNDDGKIDYSEFITAAVNRAKLLSKRNLDMAFEMFDKNKDGKISIAELKAVFANGHALSPVHDESDVDEEMWTKIISEVDKNHD